MSDQEFFFEEEVVEEVPTQGAKPSAAPRAAVPAQASGGFFSQNVAMSVVALVGVICLLLGVIIGFFLAPKPVQTMSTIPGAPAGMGGMGGTAPSLSNEQMQQGMPAGHPPIESMPGAGEAAPEEGAEPVDPAAEPDAEVTPAP